MQWPSLADREDAAAAKNCTAGNRRNTPISTGLPLTPVTDARLNLHHSADVLPISSTMPELNGSLRLSNPSLQTGSTRSSENENLSSETRAQLARDVSKFGVSETRSLAPWPAKSRTCRGLFLRLKTYQKQLVSVVAEAVSANRSPARFSLRAGKKTGKICDSSVRFLSVGPITLYTCCDHYVRAKFSGDQAIAVARSRGPQCRRLHQQCGFLDAGRRGG